MGEDQRQVDLEALTQIIDKLCQAAAKVNQVAGDVPEEVNAGPLADQAQTITRDLLVGQAELVINLIMAATRVAEEQVSTVAVDRASARKLLTLLGQLDSTDSTEWKAPDRW